jgi:FMN-dependent NADH-azoreductase
MASLLKIDVSPRGDHSVSRKLGNQILEHFNKTFPGSTVVTRDLATTAMPFVDLPWIMGAYSPEEARTPEGKAALKLGDEFIAEIEAAEHILLTTPMYNFAVPAALKAWIDHVVRVGKTFKVNSDGSYAGLVQGKKAIVVVASAGAYAPGTPAETYNVETPYLKQILGFIGITDVAFIEAGGTYVLNSGKTSIDEFVTQFAPKVEALATAR